MMMMMIMIPKTDDWKMKASKILLSDSLSIVQSQYGSDTDGSTACIANNNNDDDGSSISNEGNGSSCSHDDDNDDGNYDDSGGCDDDDDGTKFKHVTQLNMLR